jgi:RNA polymerase sigma-70 factor, ECF subfamily
MARTIDQHGLAQGNHDADHAGIASAYRDHAAALYKYAIMLTSDAAAAEDAIQQVFVKLMERNGPPSPVVFEGFYLRRAVRNECYRIMKRRRREPMDLNGRCILAPADAGAVNREEQAMIERALRRLPPDQREVIHMKIYEQLTFQQIADQLDESIHTVSGRYRYGMDKLRQWLAPGRENPT